MELLISPPDLAALADPSARGAAPLLRVPEADGAPQASFALLLGLTTGAPASGEAWPPTGKELPALLPDAEGEIATASAAPYPFPVAEPAALVAAAALQARLRLADALPSIPSAALSSPSPRADAPITSPPLPSRAPTTAAAPGPQGLVESDALAVLAAADAKSAAFEHVDARAGGATAKATPAPSWLEAFTAGERRLQWPLAATPTDPRAFTAPAPSPTAAPLAAAAPLNSAAAAPQSGDPHLAAQSAGRRAELTKVLASVTGVEGASSISTDCLPSAAGHGTATSATAAPTTPTTPAAQQAPVDLRSPSWHEAFASRVQYLVENQAGEARIRLSPPELGAVDVKISLVDDKTYVQLTTATPAARDELAQSLPRLRELFTVSGLELGGASVHNGRDGHHSGHGSGTGGAPPGAAPLLSLAAALDDAPAHPPRRSPGRIDVFA
jgi:flagellar hook-length control protein FliK